ncbi:uncharacterized protein [Hoplias malabaricus]|uniref:uncharacterized protein n=1 Tax=Hoplias malabaricus TaxID=27720 RepID=UPI0034634842
MSWTIISSCSIVLVFLGGIPAQITYSKEWDVARSGRIKILKCTVSSDMALSSNPLHVYQARPGEAIRRIMHFTAGAQSATNAQGVPARFNGRVTGQTVSLTISSIASEDAGTYYCAVWKGDTVLERLRATVHCVNPQLSSVSQSSPTMRLLPLFSSLLVVALINSEHSAEEIEQAFLITKSPTKLAIIECRFPKICLNHVHWYQKKGEDLKRVQYVDVGDGTSTDKEHLGTITRGQDYKGDTDERTELRQDLGRDNNNNQSHVLHEHMSLKFRDQELGDLSALFVPEYVTVANEKVFGSGTRLYVSDSGKKPPVVSVYPISKAKNGKSTLLCLARGMFPDLVKFKWKDQSGDVPLSDSDEVLEQRDEGQEVRVSSMLIIDQQKAASNIYTCSVQHESNDKAIEKIIPAHSEDKEDNSTHGSDPNCPPSTVKQDKQGEQEGEEGPVANNGSLELVQNMKLFILSYLTLLAKNVLYFSAVAILLIKKTVGKNKSVSSNSTKPRAS